MPLVVRIPYGGGIRGGLYHSQNVEAYFFHTPGLKVVAPSTPYDAKGLLKSSIRDNSPVVFVEHKKSYRLVRGEVPEEDYCLPIGVADVKRDGSDVTVVTYGLMVHYCLAAAAHLEGEGVSVEVIDLRTLKPLDRETILGSVKKTGKALVVHEDNITGGVGAEVAALLAEEAFEYLGRAHHQAMRTRHSHNALCSHPGGSLPARYREDRCRPAEAGVLLVPCQQDFGSVSFGGSAATEESGSEGLPPPTPDSSLRLRMTSNNFELTE